MSDLAVRQILLPGVGHGAPEEAPGAVTRVSCHDSIWLGREFWRRSNEIGWFRNEPLNICAGIDSSAKNHDASCFLVRGGGAMP
jgi:hypothetical protein